MNPIRLPKPNNYVAQWFGAQWIAQQDMVVGGIPLRKGDNVYKKVFGLEGHNGIDFVAPLGEPIYAIFSGYIIEQTARDTGYGLRISHRFQSGGKEYMAVYGHMQRLERNESFGWNWNKRDYFVKEGDVIGYVNSTGFSTGNHCHLGIYACDSKGQYLNPNNGYGGCVDPWPLILKGQQVSNAKLVKKGNEYGFYLPATTEQAMIDKALNLGIFLPTTDNGTKVDWAALRPDIIVP
jgi:murein DD-endopeptidase MepM/ murein hydrolase activator NlpD